MSHLVIVQILGVTLVYLLDHLLTSGNIVLTINTTLVKVFKLWLLITHILIWVGIEPSRNSAHSLTHALVFINLLHLIRIQKVLIPEYIVDLFVSPIVVNGELLELNSFLNIFKKLPILISDFQKVFEQELHLPLKLKLVLGLLFLNQS